MDPIKKYAVAGFPVSHSKSPLIFNRLFSITGFPGFYTRISAASVEEATKMFTSLGLAGMNVTSPLKNKMVESAEKTDAAAERIKAVNTLENSGGTINGYNTDYLGVSGALSDMGIEVRGKKCLVMGAGNAGRAAVYALTGMGGHVTVVNRTYKKAHILAGDMECRSEVIEKLHPELSNCDIFVSAITGGKEWARENWFRRDTVIFEADYLHSPLREAAIAAGCTYIPGEAWLWHQAVPAFGIFTGKDIPEPAYDIPDLLGKASPPVSRIRLTGEISLLQSAREGIRRQEIDIETDIVSSPEELNRTKSKEPKGSRTYTILIYSGESERVKRFLPHSDLIVWGRGGIKDCTERVLKEISHVR